MRATAMIKLKRFGLVSIALLTLGIGASSAEALVAAPFAALSTANSVITPAAMCGRSCRSGGRYIPGPPDVCYQNGLEYCGSSRGGGGGGGVGVVIPGTGIGVGVGPQGGGVYVGPQQNCRPISI